MWVFIDGKTLCEILTVADAMLLPMAGSRVDGNLFRHGSVRPSLQRGGRPQLGAGHLVSWIRHMVEKPSTNAGREFLLPYNCTVNWNRCHAQTASVRHGSAFQAVIFGDFVA